MRLKSLWIWLNPDTVWEVGITIHYKFDADPTQSIKKIEEKLSS